MESTELTIGKYYLIKRKYGSPVTGELTKIEGDRYTFQNETGVTSIPIIPEDFITELVEMNPYFRKGK